MYLLRYWFKKNFPFKDYENAEVDPDPIIMQRKATLKSANSTLREKLVDDILAHLSLMDEEAHCNDVSGILTETKN
jgi:hypothetical protein